MFSIGIIQKIVFDYLTFIAEAKDKVLKIIMGVGLHYMPQDRLTTDLHHRLRTHNCFFTQTSTQTTSKNHSLHTLYSQADNPGQHAKDNRLNYYDNQE
jgi:hypothetical protein